MIISNRFTRWFAVQLREGATRELAAPPGEVTVHCRSGEVWITHDGDPKDVILQADQSYTVCRRDRLTVHALRCAGLEIQIDARP